MSCEPTYLIVSRAADKDPAGRNVEVRFRFASDVTLPDLDEHRRHVRTLFHASFGDEPERVGCVVLPYVDELDEEPVTR